ncbi:hypothetical protein PCANC_23777 [Puccinia coronata f. sp. avenae]|uniref:Uncharacterized protein n=1 Tax=Puccinia coronata f. sp. avenae TaxID=200324 RepID=A0A2N5SFE9_9BASI|nr:hypothetical protein PCANC_23777 [Puccinia coronata f. sp. avenae]PLW49650.1 hypothetical protein PCASD_02223 [Puccinia coronata f. sp. avenae]
MRSNLTKDDFQNSLNQQEDNTNPGWTTKKILLEGKTSARPTASGQPVPIRSRTQAWAGQGNQWILPGPVSRSGAGQAGLARGRPGPSQLPSLRPKKALPEELASLVLKAIQATECNNQTAADMYYDMYRTPTGASAEEPTQTPNLK